MAFEQVWLFTVGPKSAGAADGTFVAEVRPVPSGGGSSYGAEFLKSTFRPGMRAPGHVRSGPAAIYAVSGDTCLESSDGIQ